MAGRSSPTNRSDPPARVLDGAAVTDSLLSPGVTVSGTVRRSVLGPGVTVEAGAEVVDSVVFADTLIDSGTSVVAAIVDSGCVIGRGAHIGSSHADLDDSDQVTLVGRGSTVAPGQNVPPGSRLEPGSTA